MNSTMARGPPRVRLRNQTYPRENQHPCRRPITTLRRRPRRTRQQERNGHSLSQICQSGHSRRRHTWGPRTKRGKETRNYGICTHPPFSGAPRKRRDNSKSKTNSIMAWNDHLDYKLHQRLCNLPTEQDLDPQTKNPTILNYY